jgi:hypothetical protein
VLQTVESYGKHLFYWWANGHVGHVHLGLIGKYRVAVGPDAPVLGQVRMRLETDRATIDLMGPNECSIITPDDRDAIVERLGPDPLRRDAKPALAIERMARASADRSAAARPEGAGRGGQRVPPKRCSCSLSTRGALRCRRRTGCRLGHTRGDAARGVKDNKIITITA